jgi:hypothetical protein
MENISVIETKKGTRVTSPNEDNANFFITKALFSLSFLNKAEQLNSIVIWKNWQSYVRLFVGEDLNFVLMLRSCIITMPLLTTRSLSGSF